MKPEIIVVTSAYGSGKAQQAAGQAAFLPIIASAGADGVEIRRELLSPLQLNNLPTLAQAIEQQRLSAVYSAPETLFTPQHILNPRLPALLAEARQLRASRLKLSLGRYLTGFAFDELDWLLRRSQVQLLIENDQTPDGGILPPLSAFFQAVAENSLPIGMTFDMANWHWVGQDPFAAADRLAGYVDYIHVKAATQGPEGWRAIALDDSDGSWRELLARLPQGIPHGIEFPLQGDNLAAVTRYYLDLLREE